MPDIYDLFKKDIVVIHTPTVVNFKDVLEFLFSIGFTWNGSCYRTYNLDRWNWCRSRTCICVENERITYSSVQYYIRYRYNVISSDEFFRLVRFHRCEELLKDFV